MITSWSFSADTLSGNDGVHTASIHREGTAGAYSYYAAVTTTLGLTAADTGKILVISLDGALYHFLLGSTFGGEWSWWECTPLTAGLDSIEMASGSIIHLLQQPNYNWGFSASSITISWLKGKTVWVVDPTYAISKTVDSSTGTLLAGGTGTSSVQVGLPFTCDIETLDINSPQTNLRTKQKLITSVQFLIDESRTLYAGNTFTNLFETAIDTVDDYNAATGVMSGVGSVIIQGQWSRNGRVCVRHTDPRAMSILAAIPEVTIG